MGKEKWWGNLKEQELTRKKVQEIVERACPTGMNANKQDGWAQDKANRNWSRWIDPIDDKASTEEDKKKQEDARKKQETEYDEVKVFTPASPCDFAKYNFGRFRRWYCFNILSAIYTYFLFIIKLTQAEQLEIKSQATRDNAQAIADAQAAKDAEMEEGAEATNRNAEEAEANKLELQERLRELEEMLRGFQQDNDELLEQAEKQKLVAQAMRERRQAGQAEEKSGEESGEANLLPSTTFDAALESLGIYAAAEYFEPAE